MVCAIFYFNYYRKNGNKWSILLLFHLFISLAIVALSWFSCDSEAKQYWNFRHNLHLSLAWPFMAPIVAFGISAMAWGFITSLAIAFITVIFELALYWGMYKLSIIVNMKLQRLTSH